MHKVNVVVPAYPADTTSAKLYLGVTDIGLVDHELTKTFDVKPGDNLIEFEKFDTLENMLHYSIVYTGASGDVATRVRSIANTFVDDILNCNGLVNPFKQGGAGLGVLYEDINDGVVPRQSAFSEYFAMLSEKAGITLTMNKTNSAVGCISYRTRQLISVQLSTNLYGTFNSVIIPAIVAITNAIKQLGPDEYLEHAGRKWKPIVLKLHELEELRMLYSPNANQANNMSSYIFKHDYTVINDEPSLQTIRSVNYSRDTFSSNSINGGTNLYLTAYSFAFELVKE